MGFLNLITTFFQILLTIIIWIANLIISILKWIFGAVSSLFSTTVNKGVASNDARVINNLKTLLSDAQMTNKEIKDSTTNVLKLSSYGKYSKPDLDNQLDNCIQIDATLSKNLGELDADLSNVGTVGFNFSKTKYRAVEALVKSPNYKIDISELKQILGENSGDNYFITTLLSFAGVTNLVKDNDNNWRYTKNNLNYMLQLDKGAKKIKITAKSIDPITFQPTKNTLIPPDDEDGIVGFNKQHELIVRKDIELAEIDHYDVFEYFEAIHSYIHKKEINEYANKKLLTYRQATELESSIPHIIGNLKKTAPPPADYFPDNKKMHGGKQRWAQIDDTVRAGMTDNEGFIIGKLGYGTPLYTGKYSGHIATIASTRSGKGVGVVIPNLLRHKGSAVILDPKGENFFTTARKRRELGNRVYYLDPWDIVGDYSRKNRCSLSNDAIRAYINPLDMIEENDPEILNKANMLAASMISREGGGGEQDFFLNGAELLLTRLIIYVCTTRRQGSPSRNLNAVRKLLTGSKDTLINEVQAWCVGKVHQAVSELNYWLSDNFVKRKNKAAINFFQFAQEGTDFLMDPRVKQAIAKSNLDILELKKTPMSIYLIFDMDKLVFNQNYYKPLIRLIIATCMMGAARNEQPKDSVLFMLDEIAQFGTLSYLPSMLAIYAGKGVVVWTIWQNLSQLKKHYEEDWATILGNCSVQQFFGVNDQETAEYISKMAGMTTIYEESYNSNQTHNTSQTDNETRGNQYSTGTSDTRGTSSNFSYQGFNHTYGSGKSTSLTSSSNYTNSYSFSRSIQVGFSETTGRNLAKKAVALLTPFEVTTGNNYDVQFIFYMSKCPYPILSGKIKYYEDKEFYGEYSENLTRI